jgi:hypothetical protein
MRDIPGAEAAELTMVLTSYGLTAEQTEQKRTDRHGVAQTAGRMGRLQSWFCFCTLLSATISDSPICRLRPTLFARNRSSVLF